MTTLLAYLTPIDITAVKVYLGVSGSAEDDRITLWYTSAVKWCNGKLSKRDFVDDAGVSTDPPEYTVMAVYEYVRVFRDIVNALGIGQSGTGIKKEKTAAREREFFGPSSGMSAAHSAQAAAFSTMELACEDVTLFSSGGAGY